MANKPGRKVKPGAYAQIRERVQEIQALLNRLPARESISRLTKKDINAHWQEIDAAVLNFDIDNFSREERNVVDELVKHPGKKVDGITYELINSLYNSVGRYAKSLGDEMAKREKAADNRRIRSRESRRQLPEPLTDEELQRRRSISQREAAATLGYKSDRQIRKLLTKNELHKTANGRIVVDE